MTMFDLRPGSELGGYEIETLIGRGGMGVVYRAHHSRLGRKVALKVLAPELAQNESFRERFVRESQMAAATDHPHIIPVYDAGEAEGLLYIAMRYVEGTDLKAELIAAGALDPGRALSIVSQVASALDAAHARGLVHRDVKPANILVVPGGSADGSDHIYLTDFGLTRHSSASGFTATGQFVGTIDYIAPEQIEGKEIDGRTDVYALTCVLYECLTGRVPFIKDADVAAMFAHLMEPPPPVTSGRPDLPAAIDAAIAKGMAKAKEERHPTCGDLVSEVRAALGVASGTFTVEAVAAAPTEPVDTVQGEGSTPASGARPLGDAGRRRRWLASGAAALVVVVLWAVVAPGGPRLLRPRDRDRARRDARGQTGPGPLVGQTVYVSPTGNDSDPGSENEPFATIERAVRDAGPGTTVLLADGTYEATTSPMVPVTSGGVTGKELRIAAAPGAEPLLRGSAAATEGIVLAPDVTDVTISGLTLEGFTGGGISLIGGRHANISLKDLRITDGGPALRVQQVDGLTLNHSVLAGNSGGGFLCAPGPCIEVVVANTDIFKTRGDESADAVHIESGEDVEVRDSYLYNNAGSGLESRAPGTRVFRSAAVENGEDGIALAGGDPEIRDSLSVKNADSGVRVGAGGVVTVANCIIADNGAGGRADGVEIALEQDQPTVLQLFNSILSNNNGDALVLGDVVKVARIDFNLFSTGSNANAAVVYRGERFTEGDLNYGRWFGAGGRGAGTYAASPTFVGPYDYHLTADSHGVDGGVMEGATRYDIDGERRPQGKAPDMGPYER